MAEPQEVQLRILGANHGANKEKNSMVENSSHCQVMNQSIIMNKKTRYYLWLRAALYATFVLVGQSAATLLGRLYFEKGGNSRWMGTLVQLAGFPILLPYYCIIIKPKNKNLTTNNAIQYSNQPSAKMKALVYVFIGLLAALNCYLYSVGIQYLPVSTFSLICASQLIFNAVFSYFLNSLKFTPYIINSIVLLIISSILLVLQNEPSSSTNVSKKHYVIGIICTISTNAGYGLMLSLTQFAYRKVLKRETVKAVMDMTICLSIVATIAILVGLFASGEWKRIKQEMEHYEMGKASYVLNLTFAAILWQLYFIGFVGLIFEVSSLFANAVSILCVPTIPVLAVIFFHDKMHGIKVISLVLAVWGFISYVYQQYLDECKTIVENRNTPHVPDVSSLLDEVNK